MQNYLKAIFVFLFACFFACKQKDDGAKLGLERARLYYVQKEYSLAKQEIDSLNKLYPKAIEERRASLLLLDSVRRSENIDIINKCDSIITVFSPEVDKMKKLFTYQRNKEYQETGSYVPKESVMGSITHTTLRSGVGEDGILYLESVFIGKQKHNQIKVSTKDGSFAQSKKVTADGLNYRFSNLGKDFEVIRFSGDDENGVARFIFVNADKPLTTTIEGQGKVYYILSQTIKTAISKSFQLSAMMLQLDSLKEAKNKAEFNMYNLDKKKELAGEIAVD